MPEPNPPAFFILQVGNDGAQCDAWPGQPLLASLEQGGLDWPSSCRGGHCRTCIGQLAAGRVHYRIDGPGLTPEEIADGWVLPCVAYPDSDARLHGSGI